MLEERLGSIQVVTGMLKVLRSYPLLSLSFLKSLRSIEGIKPNKSRDVVDSFQYALLAVPSTLDRKLVALVLLFMWIRFLLVFNQ